MVTVCSLRQFKKSHVIFLRSFPTIFFKFHYTKGETRSEISYIEIHCHFVNVKKSSSYTHTCVLRLIVFWDKHYAISGLFLLNLEPYSHESNRRCRKYFPNKLSTLLTTILCLRSQPHTSSSLLLERWEVDHTKKLHFYTLFWWFIFWLVFHHYYKYNRGNLGSCYPADCI